jgi:hypothetical protein
VEPAYFSQQEVELDTRGAWLECAAHDQAQTARGPFAPWSLSPLGWEGAGQADDRALRRRARRQLARGLVVASGANLLVSYDRAMLDAVAPRILAVNGQALCATEGGWAATCTRAGEDRECSAPAIRNSKTPRGGTRRSPGGSARPFPSSRISASSVLPSALKGASRRSASPKLQMDHCSIAVDIDATIEPAELKLESSAHSRQTFSFE